MVEANGAHEPSLSPEEMQARFDAHIKDLFVQVLNERIPAIRAGLKQEVLAQAEADLAKLVTERKAEVDAYRNGTADTAVQHQEDPGRSLADTIRWGIAALPKVGMELLQMWGAAEDIRMKKTNPFIMLTELKKTNPEMVAYAAQLFAPDPLQNYLPGLLAKNSVDTANAVVRVLVRQGLGPKGGGRFAADPFDEPPEEPGLPSNDYEPLPPERERQSAEMNNRRGAKREPSPRGRGRVSGQRSALREALREALR